METVRKILLDTDPGGDDSVALLWLANCVHQGLAELVAVTTAAGNVSAHRTFTSASQLLALGGLPAVPVGRGQAAETPQADASHIHGADGMGNLAQTLPPSRHDWLTAPTSVEVLIDTIAAHPGEVTIAAIAPFTNLAQAEAQHPGILRQAQEVVLMAGAVQAPGNVTPTAEFNVWFDPAAAHTVLNSGAKIVVIPLDVTRHLIFTEAMAQQITQAHATTPLAQFLLQLCRFMTQTALTYRETAGVPGFLVHDAATIAYLLYPELFTFRRVNLQVETLGQWTYGQTVVDWRHQPKPAANVWLATQVDATNFFACLVEDFKMLVAPAGDRAEEQT